MQRERARVPLEISAGKLDYLIFTAARTHTRTGAHTVPLHSAQMLHCTINNSHTLTHTRAHTHARAQTHTQGCLMSPAWMWANSSREHAVRTAHECVFSKKNQTDVST